jgi:hypothetical protein
MHTAAQEQQQQQLASVTGSRALQELPACSSNSSKTLLQVQHQQVEAQLVQQHQQHLLLLPQILALGHP